MDTRKNFGFRHKAGVILPVSSLPGKYGIGTFGPEAYDFVDFLSETGHKCWQVLPLNPTAYGDSPYQSPAALAGNPYFIDPELLAAQGLLTRKELAEHQRKAPRVDYGWLFENRYRLLRLAYSRFAPDRAYRAFVKKNETWLESYALFMALKERYGYRPWTLWAQEHRSYAQAISQKAEFEPQLGFWRWCQYEFAVQWDSLRRYAHQKGISIIGDLPIYVAHDSVDVWADPEQFLLDESYNPTVVAGCPPDGFSPDGQLWGNPIYNWPLMESQGFAWWQKRVKQAFRMYDILRIDHFRGFAGYYTIPFGDATARNGVWRSAPGLQLFRTLKEAFPKAKIIAEDLGFITEDVRELLEDTGFPGMKMIHFAFYDEDSENLPRMFQNENCVAYSASHDSDCTRTWLQGLNGLALERFQAECPHRKGQSRVYDVIEFAMESRANLAMVPMQDYLLLTNAQGRMNEPATATGNWTWRVSSRYNTEKRRAEILALLKRTKRNK